MVASEPLNASVDSIAVQKMAGEPGSTSKKYARIEFKRYEPTKNCLETYVAKVPAKQEKLVHFFTMVRPLVEGCNFNLLPQKTALKLELQPGFNKITV